MATEFISAVSGGRRIRGILSLPKKPSTPCVIVSHGLFSSKDSDKFVAIAEYFSERGIAVIRYDHHGCGESDGDIGDTTVTARIGDLEAIFDVAVNHPLLANRIGLLGSSMGGFISIFKGAADSGVKALVLWATPSHMGEGREEIEEDARREGVPLLKEAFYTDWRRYDARQAMQQVDHCLILHGDTDEFVPVAQAEELYSLARHPKHVEIFRGGDHRFTDPQQRHRAIEMSFEWFERYL